MSAVNEWIAREYFEHLGYLVNQPCKYLPTGRNKRVEEDLDLLVTHPRGGEHKLSSQMLWTSLDLETVARAVVGVRGGHTERFYAARFERLPSCFDMQNGRPAWWPPRGWAVNRWLLSSAFRSCRPRRTCATRPWRDCVNTVLTG